jgi:hypothetical protein
MRKLHFMSVVAASVLAATLAQAGNDEKRGQAGFGQLLMNPWSRSSGMAGANTANIRGVESMNFNVGGLSQIQKTEFVFSNTTWLQGSDTRINALGFAQSVGGGSGVIGISVMAVNLGNLYETTVDQPEGTGRTFTPQIFNGAFAYSRIFSNSISGGITLRVVNESTPNINATGVLFDAGVQYKTGEREEFKFGVALRNVGPNVSYRGEGLTFRGNSPGARFQNSVTQKSASLQMPSLLNIGASYDINTLSTDHNLTVSANFQSHTYTYDQIQGGVEYRFRSYAALRAGIAYYQNVFSDITDRTDVHRPFSGGFSLQLPIGEEKLGKVALDYSYRSSNPFGGTHSIGLTVTL